MLITGSLVTYHNDKRDLKNVINSFLNTKLNVHLFVSDNSNEDSIKELCNDSRITYIYNNCNLGFGAGHNIAIKLAEKINSNYHIALNPDIYFGSGTLEKSIDFMEKHQDIGLLMPKILYPNGNIQYVCKLLPTPFNMFSRAFLPNKGWIRKINDKFELKFTDYNQAMNVPYISGCCMFFRTKVFNKVGYFDENVFMHMEDTDISRRITKISATVMYPEVQVYHKWEKGTYKSKKMMIITIKSAIYYFNKWGWFFDKDRKDINREILKNLFYKSKEERHEF